MDRTPRKSSSHPPISRRPYRFIHRKHFPAYGLWIVCTLVVATGGSAAPAADLSEARKLYLGGKYEACIDLCTQGVAENRWVEGLWVLKIRAEVTLGKYSVALRTAEAATEIHQSSIPVRWAAVEAYQAAGKYAEARAERNNLIVLAERAPRRLEDVPARVAAGTAVLQDNGDARRVLETYFDRAKKDDPSSPLPYLAVGQLALAKHDRALAAESFATAVKKDAADPDAHLGLARALEDEDTPRSTAALAKALELNPRHVPSLLFRADQEIDREDYAAAEATLKSALDVNPAEPLALAYRAVMAHLAGDAAAETASRAAALANATRDPEVDHLIGLKLSQKYRFAEGESYQRRALELDPGFGPANVQRCQDLLRLGKEDEGWKRAKDAFDADPYDVVAFNLVTLHDTLAAFRTLAADGLVVRMDPAEADAYGGRVVELLTRARRVLGAKYGVSMDDPVTVEIFPRQSDFAIRTFGLPGGSGFLGVCFGPVVTVNGSTARTARASNWEAVCWHEFCHAVTLRKTKNKMPRWLSEGISVYEERQENPAWGQSMNPAYRELILKSGATKVSRLSSAFLRPPTPNYLQFAYFESSMVVEYVVRKYGPEALGRILTDLGGGVPINDALARHTAAIDDLDAGFAAWLTEQAESFGKGVDWEKPATALDADSTAMAGWNKEHPNSFAGLLGEGRALLAERKFEKAKAPLAAAAALWPACGEPGGPYLLLAQAHRELGEAAAERRTLEKHATLDADGVEPRLRLVDLAAAAGDWPAVTRYADQALAVKPMTSAPHRAIAQAAESTGDRARAIAAHRTLLQLDPLDRAEHHFRLARLLSDDKQLPAARKEIVLALEEAPRYREAHKLLLEIVGQMEKEPPATAPAVSPGASTNPTTAPAAPPTPAATLPAVPTTPPAEATQP